MEQHRRVQLIEKTGKGYKGCIVVGYIIMVIGFVACAGSGGDPDAIAGGWGLFGLGFVITAGAKLFSWWDHG